MKERMSVYDYLVEKNVDMRLDYFISHSHKVSEKYESKGDQFSVLDLDEYFKTAKWEKGDNDVY